MRDVLLIPRQTERPRQPPYGIDRVRCVLVHDQRYLLAQHHTRRARNRSLWGLVGGRLHPAEKPKAGLKRELMEELGCRPSRLLELGDWLHRDETYRVYGGELRRTIETFDEDEIRAIDWFTYAEVAELAAAERLRIGFELAAITKFRRAVTARS
jgi:8-oxo-dGTP pyrophosphatase MutT (NUDIX family)